MKKTIQANIHSRNRVFSPLPPPPPPPLEMSRESSPISSVSGKSIKLLTLQLKETMHKKNSFFHSSYVKKEETGIINGESIQVTKKAESSQFSDSSPILLVNPHVHTEAPEPTPKEHMERKWYILPFITGDPPSNPWKLNICKNAEKRRKISHNLRKNDTKSH